MNWTIVLILKLIISNNDNKELGYYVNIEININW